MLSMIHDKLLFVSSVILWCAIIITVRVLFFALSMRYANGVSGLYLPTMLKIIVLWVFLLSKINVFANVASSSTTMVFNNKTKSAVRLTIEERCLPSYQNVGQSHLIAPGELLSLHYDLSVAHCVVLVPDSPTLGGKSHLYMLEPKSSGSPFDLQPSSCEVVIGQSPSSHYSLKSTCMQVTSSEI
jgi:hypothetical protein